MTWELEPICCQKRKSILITCCSISPGNWACNSYPCSPASFAARSDPWRFARHYAFAWWASRPLRAWIWSGRFQAVSRPLGADAAGPNRWQSAAEWPVGSPRRCTNTPGCRVADCPMSRIRSCRFSWTFFFVVLKMKMFWKIF